MKPPVCPLPEMFLTACDAPSEASPANADKPSVYPIVGNKLRPNTKMEDNRLPPTCFLMLVLANLCLFLYSLGGVFLIFQQQSLPQIKYHF